MIVNKSGIYPKGERILIKVDSVDDSLSEFAKKLIPEEIKKQYETASKSGVLVECGDDAWTDHRSAFAVIGDRVLHQRHMGVEVVGADGEPYRVMNDLDIVAVIDDTVQFDDLERREPLSGVG